jgi:hypothetical protein
MTGRSEWTLDLMKKMTIWDLVSTSGMARMISLDIQEELVGEDATCEGQVIVMKVSAGGVTK